TTSPASRSRDSCAVHSIATSRGAIRPARARATKVPNGWSWPVRASHRLPPHETGRPVVRFKCNPTPSSGKDGDERSRSRWAASVQPGAFTSTETEDTTPVSCASSTPRLTPADKPKSSALTMRRRASGIAASPVVPADLYQVSQHLDGVRGEPHGAGLVVVPIVHRRLRHLEAVFPGDVQQLDVEAEARKHRLKVAQAAVHYRYDRSEEHTSELQSPDHLLFRLLVEKKRSGLSK